HLPGRRHRAGAPHRAPGRAHRRRRAGVRGPPQGPAGLVHPGAGARRQPGQRGAPRHAWSRSAAARPPGRHRRGSRAVDNLIPGAYRGVAVAWVDGPFTADALVAHLTGREAYRRTRWIVARSRRDGATALVAVHRPASEALFSPIVSVEVLAGPDETCFLERHELDTAVPAQLARATEDPAAAGARCVVVHGRYGHVSFVLDPRPVRIRVREVLPPAPAKLLDQAQRVLDVAEDLPPILLEAEEFSLADHVPAAGPVLLPCRGADIDLPGRDTWFLDERPPHHDWTLLGCARSR